MELIRHKDDSIVSRLRSPGGDPPVSSDVLRQGKSMEIIGTTTRIMGNQGQGKDSSHQSLDQRFTDKDHRLPTTARHHQCTIVEAKDKDVMHQSLDQRFSSKDRQPPMTASHHLWSMVKAQDNCTDRPSLDQRFSNAEGLSPASTLYRRASFSGPVDCGEDRAVTRRWRTRIVGCHCCNRTRTNHATYSHWAAGLRRTSGSIKSQCKDKQCHSPGNGATTTSVDQSIGWRPTTDHGQDRQVNRGYKDIRTGHSKCRSTRHRLYGVETCDPGDDHWTSTRWINLHLQMSTYSGNGRHHHLHQRVVKALRVILCASSGGRKHVGDGSEVDYGSGSQEEDTATCSETRRHRFSDHISDDGP